MAGTNVSFFFVHRVIHMLNIEILALVTISCLFLVAVVCFLTWRRADAAFTWAEAAFKYVQEHNAEEISRKQLAAFSAELSDLAESYDQLLESHKKLRARVSMRDVRARRKADEDAAQDENGVDIHSDRDKNALRLELRRQGLLKG